MNLGIVIKSSDDREFEAYISVEIVDRQNDVVPIAVLDKAFRIYRESGGQLQLLHSNIPVGNLIDSKIEVDPESKEDAYLVRGKIFNDGRSIPDKVWEAFINSSDSAPVSFSIGGKPLKYHYEEVEGKQVRYHDELELYEVSVICSIDGIPHQPANPRAVLRSLETNSFMPVLCKMVINMTKEEENKKTEIKKEDVANEESDQQNSSVLDDVRKEAEALRGNNQTLGLLKQYKDQNDVLTKQVTEQQTQIDTITKDNEGLKSKIATLNKEITTKTKMIEAWRVLYKELVGNEAVIKKMLSTTNVATVHGGIPPNQSNTQRDQVIEDAKKQLAELDEKMKKGEIPSNQMFQIGRKMTFLQQQIKGEIK